MFYGQDWLKVIGNNKNLNGCSRKQTNICSVPRNRVHALLVASQVIEAVEIQLKEGTFSSLQGFFLIFF